MSGGTHSWTESTHVPGRSISAVRFSLELNISVSNRLISFGATADIGSLIDCCLNETCTPTWGIYSCDIDRSGKVGAADLLRLIDLLNGAGAFDEWMGSGIP